jgi:hypothetical protein
VFPSFDAAKIVLKGDWHFTLVYAVHFTDSTASRRENEDCKSMCTIKTLVCSRRGESWTCNL